MSKSRFFSEDELTELGMADDDFVGSNAMAFSKSEICTLMDESLTERQIFPAATSPEIERLTFELNKISYVVYKQTCWTADFALQKQFADGLIMVEEASVKIKQQFETVAEILRQGEGEEFAHRFHSGSIMLGNLLQQITELRAAKVGFGAVFDQPATPDVEEQFGRKICQLFHEAVDSRNPPKGASKSAGYKFAAKVLSKITKNDVRADSLKTILVRDRDVNRSRHLLLLHQVQKPD